MITQVLPLSDLSDYFTTPGIIDSSTLVAKVGDLQVVSSRLAAVVNSRQRRLPKSEDPWLRETVRAVETAINQGISIVSSVGMITWEWVVWHTKRLGGNQVIVLPRGKVSSMTDRVEEIVREFDLDVRHTVFLMPFHAKDKRIRKEVYPERDRWVMALAERIFPVSMRESGVMSKLLADPDVIGQVDNSYQIPYIRYRDDREGTKQLLVDVDGKINVGDWDYLTHWTRSCHGAWTGERICDFYQDLYTADNGYPRDGLQTLKRILQEGKIRGSDELVRGSEAMVSLTETTPEKLLDIIRWRPGFIRWNFEPYGISIKRQALESMGARSVRYGSEAQFRQLSETDGAYFQLVSPEGKDWGVEKEWRVLGDIDLGVLDTKDVIVWVLKEAEIKETREISRFAVRSLIT